MTVGVQVAGLATVKVATAAGGTGALQTLGYSQDGVFRTSQTFVENVPGDENGGQAGPPVEIQYMGEIEKVRIELMKWDPTVMAYLLARFRGATVGTPPVAGGLVFAGNGYFRLCCHYAAGLTGQSADNNPCATLVSEPIEINKGTKWSRMVMEFVCYKHPTSGIVKDSSYS
jgi:hypothetical protein